MKILLLTPRLPWPPRDGGRVAMSRLAESLARCGAEVEVLSLNPRKHRASPAGPLPVRAIDIDTSRVAGPALRAAGGRIPYIVARFVSRAFRDAVDAALARFGPDVVQIESPFLLPYEPVVRGRAKTVLRSLNVEFRIWEGLARIERNPLRRAMLRRVAASLADYELRAVNGLDAILPISEADREDFARLGCTRPMHVVPCGVPLPPRGEERPEPGRIGFIGSLDFLPNQDAVRWILDELWPRVRVRVPDATLAIAGSAPPPWLHARARAAGAELLGDIPDPAAFLRRAAILIAPLFAGGGMRIKVVEAMALGKPIVATTLGAGGIDVDPGRDIVLADDVEAFCDAVVYLLRDSETAERIGDAARATVAARYDPAALARGLLRFYESL